MIRDRRRQDLARLAEVLAGLDAAAGVLQGREATAWLTEVVAEQSWVFDQAPVTVAPTDNVIGHVQIRRPDGESWVGAVAARSARPVTDLMVIGRLFVQQVEHDHGFARHLLRQSVQYVEDRGCVPVLDPDGRALVPSAPCSRMGFTDLTVDGAVVGVRLPPSRLDR